MNTAVFMLPGIAAWILSGPVVVHLWKKEKASSIGLAVLLIVQSAAAAVGYIAYINWQSTIPY